MPWSSQRIMSQLSPYKGAVNQLCFTCYFAHGKLEGFLEDKFKSVSLSTAQELSERPGFLKFPFSFWLTETTNVNTAIVKDDTGHPALKSDCLGEASIQAGTAIHVSVRPSYISSISSTTEVSNQEAILQSFLSYFHRRAQILGCKFHQLIV